MITRLSHGRLCVSSMCEPLCVQKEGIFGPVVVVMPCDSLDDLINTAS